MKAFSGQSGGRPLRSGQQTAVRVSTGCQAHLPAARCVFRFHDNDWCGPLTTFLGRRSMALWDTLLDRSGAAQDLCVSTVLLTVPVLPRMKCDNPRVRVRVTRPQAPD